MSNLTLLTFLCKCGINKTNNVDLEMLLKVLIKDELKLKHIEESKEISLIVNYQNSSQKEIHWVGYYKDFYIDSYGIPPIKILEPYVEEYNKIDYQSNTDSSYCGQLTL